MLLKVNKKLIFLLSVLILVSNTTYSQEDFIRVDTNLVTVPVSVLDRDGRYVTNLKKEDFQIFEDGAEQEIALFEPVEEPFTIFFLLDVSGSMTNEMVSLTNAANIFVRKLRPDDKLIAATFAENVNILFQATKIKELKKDIKLTQHFGSHYTLLYDAVDITLKKINKIKGRKAIVLFSDGAGAGTFASAKSNLRDAKESDALIYTIQFQTFSDEPLNYLDRKSYLTRIKEINDYMRDLANVSGGRNYQIKNISDLAETFGIIADELGQQYSLGYYPKQVEKEKKENIRQIKVKVNQPNLAVRARSSYVIERK
jgi:Ca-activated chloride channel homolog